MVHDTSIKAAGMVLSVLTSSGSRCSTFVGEVGSSLGCSLRQNELFPKLSVGSAFGCNNKNRRFIKSNCWDCVINMDQPLTSAGVIALQELCKSDPSSTYTHHDCAVQEANQTHFTLVTKLEDKKFI